MKSTSANTIYHKIKINNTSVISKYSKLTTTLSADNQIDEKEVRLFFIESIKNIIKIGLPTMLFFLCIYLQQSISLSFVGRKYNNQNMINAIGIVNLYINCTLFCYVVGLISGLDTLLANTLGSGNLYLFGLYIHRARLITYIFCLILCIIHNIYGVKIISLFITDKQTLLYCDRFLWLSLVYILIDIQFGINFRVLAILNKSSLCLLILLISSILHLLWCYIFINVLDYDVMGAGISILLSQLINMIFSTLYIHYCRPLPDEAYFRINLDCFKGWLDYLKFTLPSAFMLCAEWMAFEVQAIFAIYISKEDYSIHIFLSNLASLLYTLCHGFGMAATILIGEYVAKGLIRQAKSIALYSFVLSEITMSFCNIFLIIFRTSVLKVFIDDKKLLEAAHGKGLIIILSIGSIFDITQSVMGSIYRGLGKQRWASVITFVQYYVVQIFFTWLFAIKLQMGVSGIWYSILLGNVLTTVLYLICFSRFNFEKINLETKERLEKDQNLLNKSTELSEKSENKVNEK
jgi:MATE family multidrug resistance protein